MDFLKKILKEDEEAIIGLSGFKNLNYKKIFLEEGVYMNKTMKNPFFTTNFSENSLL